MKTAAQLRAQAQALGLSRSAIYDALTDAQLDAIWNGYGPDRWPASIRALMTWLYRNFQASASIHDVRYEFSDGTKSGWHLADDEMAENLRLQLDALYPLSRPWLRPLRWWAQKKITAANIALAAGGFQAYRDAANRSPILKP